MPLHRNESSGEKNLAVSGIPTYVKENHHHARERSTVFTIISSSNDVPPPLQFLFKWAGSVKRVHLKTAKVTGGKKAPTICQNC